MPLGDHSGQSSQPFWHGVRGRSGRSCSLEPVHPSRLVGAETHTGVSNEAWLHRFSSLYPGRGYIRQTPVRRVPKGALCGLTLGWHKARHTSGKGKGCRRVCSVWLGVGGKGCAGRGGGGTKVPTGSNFDRCGHLAPCQNGGRLETAMVT